MGINWEQKFAEKPLREKHIVAYLRFDVENDCVECTV